jgi:hypothetical protein
MSTHRSPSFDETRPVESEAANQENPQLARSSSTSGRTAGYPFSTVVAVAVVAFLFGSLIRSLLLPADFIYFSTVLDDNMKGWREVKRLVEVKYIFGGWNVVIGVIQ